jgi:hypothetical protein
MLNACLFAMNFATPLIVDGVFELDGAPIYIHIHRSLSVIDKFKNQVLI